MGIIFACIAPHGAESIPELGGSMLDAYFETRAAMQEIASLVDQQKPDTIIIATPHNLRLEAIIGIIATEYSAGILEENNGKVEMRLECDRQLAKELTQESHKRGLPTVTVNYGASEGPASCMPMDWGTLVPLYFLTDKSQKKTKIVIITPSREIPLKALVSFGQVIVDVAENSRKRIVFVASADQGHAHRADGPYGYDPASKQFDKIVQTAVRNNDLRVVLDLPADFIQEAKPDSVWQLAILQGVLEKVKMSSRLLSYQAPTYYGLLCAAYLPV